MNLWKILERLLEQHERRADKEVDVTDENTNKVEEAYTGPSESEKRSNLYFEASFFVRYRDGKQWMCHPFREREAAIVRSSETGGLLFEKIATATGGGRWICRVMTLTII